MSVDVYRVVTDRIIEALETGTVPWRNPILGGQGVGWPKNLASGKGYRGSNVFLLALSAWAEGYESSYWLTFRQAKERGGAVKKGERSTLVVFWKQITVEDKETKESRRVPMLRYYRVFNVEQCEGIDASVPVMPRPATVFAPIAEAESLVDGYDGPNIEYRGSQACYIPPRDEVRIPESKRFVSSEAYYAILFHELVHSTGHSSRLDRGLDTELAPFGSPDYSKEELVAEMGAAFLCGHVGITPATLDNSAAYIKGWLKQLHGDKRLVVQAGGQAQKAVDMIRGVAIGDTNDSEGEQ